MHSAYATAMIEQVKAHRDGGLQCDSRDMIFRNFLECLAQISDSTFLCWNATEQEGIVRALLAHESDRKILLPDGGNGPLIIDPSNPTNNFADRLGDLEPLRQACVTDLKRIDATAVEELTGRIEQLKKEAEAAAKRAAMQDLKIDALTSIAQLILAPKSGSITFKSADIDAFISKRQSCGRSTAEDWSFYLQNQRAEGERSSPPVCTGCVSESHR